MNCIPNQMTNATMPMPPIAYPSAPGLGDTAPDFTAMTTDGVKSLSDYRGQWVILFSHPGDFTPVVRQSSSRLHSATKTSSTKIPSCLGCRSTQTRHISHGSSTYSATRA